MLSYLLKILAVLLFAAFIIFNYYFVASGHIVSFQGYFLYFILITFSYSIYKYFQLNNSTQTAVFSNLSIVGYFVLILFFVCIHFFQLSEYSFFISGITLFFRIIFYSILPISIFVICTSFGRFLFNKLPNNDVFSGGLKFILNLVLGFISFISLLTIFGLFGFYNLFIVILILIGFSAISYKEINLLYEDFMSKKYIFDIKEGSYMNLLSKEFFYIISFTVLSIGLVSIFRPFPIGWDDLGVYMNYPHLMAESGSLLSLGSMYIWQVFTGVGYMFGTPVAAFFLNISGLFLSFIFLIIIFSDLLKSKNKNKKYFLDLPIILSSLFISLPMITFLSTKDMKVDAGLFFISISALYLIFKYFIYLKNEKEVSIIYMFIVGIIVGFSFGIKLTALMLIIGILALISFARIGVFGLMGYLGVFFAVFTYFDLWKMMNVLVNPNNILGFEKIFSSISVLLGFILIGVGFYFKKQNILKYFKEVGIFLLGLFVVLTPWFGKNIYESYPNISINSLINGKTDQFRGDFSKLYTEEEFSEIRKNISISNRRENAITTNEDLLRYFGYENGIVDFVYMPLNLTMQKNQSGEYTDIGFLFLALLPLLFIFLPYRRSWYSLFFVFISISQLFFYLQGTPKLIDKSTYSQVSVSSIEGVFNSNNSLFKESGDLNIYDIDFENYISKELISTSITKEEIQEKTRLFITDLVNNYVLSDLEKSDNKTQEAYNELFSKYSDEFLKDFDKYYQLVYDNEIEILESEISNNFYLEIEDKVKDISLGKGFTFLGIQLTDEDFELVEKLNYLYDNYFTFALSDIVSLEKTLIENNATEEEIDIIKKVWNENRNINGKIIDFFSKINLPTGYLYLFLGFFIPTLYLIFTLKKSNITYIFLYNLVFASTYTFLWLISSFGIVWYGITMYFSFLLMIGIGGYYLSNYKNDDDENVYIAKLFGSFVFLSIFLVYFFNSVIPNSFINLKTAGYQEFKVGRISQASAIYLYHKDYKEILFTLNISEDKRKEFLEENIFPEILNVAPGILNSSITNIFTILETLKGHQNYRLYASKSLENLYKNISNPDDEYKNKEKVYRVGTFLRYYISENNNRLLEDSLLFNFNNYIYSPDLDLTIDRFKNIGVKYLLVDLNAATIDQSITKDLTNRYEKLLKTFTSDNLELVSTDSICLEIALDTYKTNKIIEDYMILAGVNYESYDDDGNMINRVQKRNQCAQYIDYLLENDLINEENFSYLIPFKNYFSNNSRSVNSINNLIGTSYRALFEIK